MRGSCRQRRLLRRSCDSWTRVVCHAKTVGDHCLIGNGATVNGDAVIGEYSIVASGSVALERAEIPPKSFVVGVPAAVKKQTSERHLQMIEAVAESYARNAQSFKSEGLGTPEATPVPT